MTDRTVHARYLHMEIVRYDKAGHWFLEPTIPGLPRQRVSVKDAAHSATWGCNYEPAAGQVFLGLPGGRSFDREFKQLMRESA